TEVRFLSPEPTAEVAQRQRHRSQKPASVGSNPTLGTNPTQQHEKDRSRIRTDVSGVAAQRLASWLPGHLVGVEGFEPPQPEGTAFTARPGSPTPAHTRKRKVDGSNVRGVTPGYGLASRPITTLATFQMAEGEGFEPPSPFGRQFSRL